MSQQSSEQVLQDRLEILSTVEHVKWVTEKGYRFTLDFFQGMEFFLTWNGELPKLADVPGNSKYSSLKVQKEILNILGDKVRNKIREEVGDSKFCIILGKACDQSKRQLLVVILRFVDCRGCVQERMFEVVDVDDDFTAPALEKEIFNLLARNNLCVGNMRGQGYNGASSMRDAWNTVQASFLRDSPCAYYVHCFAHDLHVALFTATYEIFAMYIFFKALRSIVSFLSVYSNCHSDLKPAGDVEIADLVAFVELESQSFQRDPTVSWSFHYGLITRLIDMFDATCTFLENIETSRLNADIRGEAWGIYNVVASFEFVFSLLLFKEIMEITGEVCQAVQRKFQPILNAFDLVSSTKTILQKFQQDGWDNFIGSVVSFSERNSINIPDMGARHRVHKCRSSQQEFITVEHYYHIDIFNAVIDLQLKELNSRFPQQTMELFILSSALDPTDAFKSFKIDDICNLAGKFYPQDFTQDEMHALRLQLKNYELEVLCDPQFRNMSSLSELCQGLIETGKSALYFLIDRLIRLVLTLPVHTAMTERAFSAMGPINELCNKIEDEFLPNYLVVHIERDHAESIDSDSVIDDLYSVNHARALLQ
ncbi:uncharacterized protein LOC133733795 [Rosa rugosa]|nr:uncharacterized protein LOC133733795 [Rosa rugosa]XP_062017417.1 uncharacterized protein LOC133733795 [Rosa rugosa]